MAPQMLKMGGPFLQVGALAGPTRVACDATAHRGRAWRRACAAAKAAVHTRALPRLRAALQARNFAVMTGVNSGVAAFMKRWRGKEDVNNQLAGAAGAGRGGGGVPPLLLLPWGKSQTVGHTRRPLLRAVGSGRLAPPASNIPRLLPVNTSCYLCPPPLPPAPAAAFCSGASFSLISGGLSAGGAAPMPGAPTPNPLMAAFSAGVVFALFQGGFYKVRFLYCVWLYSVGAY